MNRWITIDHPYQRITLEFDTEAIKRATYVKPLPREDWDALEKAESALHAGSQGCGGWTMVHPRDEGDEYLNRMWEECAMYVENEHFGDTPLPEHVLRARTAHRVAQALALIAFGADILLK